MRQGKVTPVWTVGHSTRTMEEFVEILAEAGIELVVDVRRYPGSRRHPHFAKDALAESLARGGIAYRHELALGGRRTPHPDSPNTAWRNPGFRGYADHMATEDFRAALDRLIVDARTRRTAILCAEAYWRQCHRQLIADALAARGLEARHLLGKGREEVHRLHPDAVVRPDGTLVYTQREPS